MKLFYLERVVDASGVSGIGRVADGVIFPNGKCVLCWNTSKSSIAVYDRIEDVKAIHGHNGQTKVMVVHSIHRTQEV